MINFKDAVPPAGKGNVRKIDGAEKTIEYPDGWENGTALNRANLMAMQGFGECETVFNADGSISETYQDGSVKKTVFNADGSIDEIFTAGTQVMTKKINFNEDGSILEVIK
mgnify:FL=1